MNHYSRVKFLFRQVTNPALVVSQPGTFRKNLTVDNPVELRDILDTCLDIAQSPRNDRGKYPGHSLLPLLTGQGTFDRQFAFGEIEGYVAISDGRYRLIKGKDAALLFDDLEDPDNLLDISQDKPELVARLSAKIDAWLGKTGPVLPPQRGGIKKQRALPLSTRK